MKCKSCENYIVSLDTCKFCHYEEKKDNPFLKWNGEKYRVISVEFSSNHNRIITEWERIE